MPKIFYKNPTKSIEGLRQTQEGYYLGCIPDNLGMVQELPFLGVRLVLSAVHPPDKILEEFKKHNIKQVEVLMGSTFRHADKILEESGKYPPEQIFIHCQHGADRTGCIAAFLLCLRHSWSIPDAFYSVLYRNPKDLLALAEILESKFGIKDYRHMDNPTVGFYSHSACGLLGGLKARSETYQKLISSTIKEILEKLPKTEIIGKPRT